MQLSLEVTNNAAERFETLACEIHKASALQGEWFSACRNEWRYLCQSALGHAFEATQNLSHCKPESWGPVACFGSIVGSSRALVCYKHPRGITFVKILESQQQHRRELRRINFDMQDPCPVVHFVCYGHGSQAVARSGGGEAAARSDAARLGRIGSDVHSLRHLSRFR